MLHHRDHPAAHEPGGTYRGAAPGHLGDLDQSAAVADLDPAARPGGGDGVGPASLAGVQNDFDTVASHTFHNPSQAPGIPGLQAVRTVSGTSARSATPRVQRAVRRSAASLLSSATAGAGSCQRPMLWTAPTPAYSAPARSRASPPRR